MLAVGVDNKPVLFYFILVNPKSNNRQPGPLVSNQRWTSCCCRSWCIYSLSWYRYAGLLRRHFMAITFCVSGKGRAVEDRYCCCCCCCCCCWICCSNLTILNSRRFVPHWNKSLYSFVFISFYFIKSLYFSTYYLTDSIS